MAHKVILGTAMWGWKVSEESAFAIADAFAESNGIWIDTASNYPINGDPAARYASENILAKWIKARPSTPISVICKVGSVSNRRIPDHDLTPAFLDAERNRLRDKFGDRLSVLMIHWDNRDDESKIRDTIEFLAAQDVDWGLSGIRSPERYLPVLSERNLSGMLVEVKHNFLVSDIARYEPLRKHNPKFIAYSINAGGLNLSQECSSNGTIKLLRSNDCHKTMLSDEILQKIQKEMTRDPRIRSLYHYSVAFSESVSSLYGYLVGPSKPSHMTDIVNFISRWRESESQ